eukprot:scaffold4233_cov142-Skeletonema_dohrnii-CCMP3373.AAC.12
MEEFLSSVDKSDVLPAPVQSSDARPQPQSTSSSVPRQQRHNCGGVIFERSTEDCDNKTGINEAQSSEDYDDFDMKLQNIDNTIDKALHNLQTQSKSEGGRKPAEYEYYNDPKYQRQTRDHSLDDDSLVAMARRLDDASIISDPSVICGTREKFPLIANQRYNRKSPEKTTSGNRGERLAHSRRSSNTSSASSSSSNLPREEGVHSNNSARHKTEEDVLKSKPAVEKETAARTFDNNKSQPSIPRSYFKDDDNRTYKNTSANHIRKENYIQPMPSSSSEYRKKSSEQVDLKSRRKRDSAPADSRYAQTIPPRASYSDFRNGSTTINSSHDSDTDDGEGSDHTEFFYESTDEGSECDDEYDPRAVGSSVADAVKDLNNQRGLKRVMNLFGKKSKGEEDMCLKLSLETCSVYMDSIVYGKVQY